MKKQYKTIDEYIKSFSTDIQKILQEIRAVIKKAAPDAEEKISYQIPTFYLFGNLVHFAAFKNHIGFYPTPHGITVYENDLSKYKQGKGSVQFPINEPIPLELIEKIVKTRVEENIQKMDKKSKNK